MNKLVNSPLSLVVTARNDDHGGNMLGRMATFIQGLALGCQKYQLEMELIIVEWNPPPDRPRLVEALSWPDRLAPLMVRFIEVPPEIHQRLENSDKIRLFQMIAKNVGLRRCRGRFVLATNIDLIFSDELMWFFSQNLLEEDCFYRANRLDLNLREFPHDASWDEMLAACQHHVIRCQGLEGTIILDRGGHPPGSVDGGILPRSRQGLQVILQGQRPQELFTNACGDFTLMAREMWLALKGHPEIPKWSIHVDSIFLHMAHVIGLKQVILPEPICTYHLEHEEGWAVQQDPRDRPALDWDKDYLPWRNRILQEQRPITPNGADWGLANEILPEYVRTDGWSCCGPAGVIGAAEVSLNRGEADPVGEPPLAIAGMNYLVTGGNESDAGQAGKTVFAGPGDKAKPMLIFATPKGFQGHIGVIQRNAIRSWTLLSPRPEIVLLGDEAGTHEIARELGLRHEPAIKTTASGAPLLNALFTQARELAGKRLLAYVNADIILPQVFMAAVEQAQAELPEFLMIGQRWDVDLTEPLDFVNPDWEAALRARVAREGTLHPVSALDYFVFTQGVWGDIPEFALGRTAWDNWLVYAALAGGQPVIDATARVMAIHQNHSYTHVTGATQEVWRGVEASRNQELAWEGAFLAYSSHATYELTKAGVRPRPAQSQAMDLIREGMTRLEAGDAGKAIEYFGKVRELLPAGIPGLDYACGKALASLQRPLEARALLIRELAAHPTHIPARDLLAQLQEAATALEFGAAAISVVIPTYNRAAYIGQALDSILAQTSPPDEVLIVDDGSTDETPEIVKPYLSARVRYLVKEHSGAAATRNYGIRQARGEFILWLDSDDVLLPETIATYRELIQHYPEVEVFYGDLQVTDQYLRRQQKISYDDWYGHTPELIGSLLTGNPFPNPGTAIRKACFERIGFYDEEFLRSEDYEWWCRFAKGGQAKHAGITVLLWRWHDTNMSTGSVKLDLSYDIKIIHKLLENFTLPEIVPGLDWQGQGQQSAEAEAYRRIAQRLGELGDEAGAQAYIQRRQEVAEAAEDRGKSQGSVSPQTAGESFMPGEGATSLGQPATQALKLLLVVHGFPPQAVAGTELYTFNLARELIRQGHSVRVLYPEYDTARPEGTCREGEYGGVPITQVVVHPSPNELAGFHNEAVATALEPYLQGLELDLVHFQHLLGLSAAVVEVCRRLHIPTLLTVHDGWFLCWKYHFLKATGEFCAAGPELERCAQCYQETFPRSPLAGNQDYLLTTLRARRDYFGRVFAALDRIIFPSQFFSRLFAHHGWSHPRTQVLPLGLVPFPVRPREPGNHPIRFTYLGNINYTKGLDVLVQAFQGLRPSGATLHIYGRIEDTGYFKTWIEPTLQRRDIVYHGPYAQEYLGEILAGTDMAVIPSRFENYPTVVRECLYAGVPVIAPAIGGVPEIIQQQVNGLLFRAGDVQDLTDQLQKVVDGKEVIDQLRRGIGPVRTLTAEVEELQEVYQHLARPARKARPVAGAGAAKPKIGFLSLDPRYCACPYIRLLAPLEYLQRQGQIEYVPLPGPDFGQNRFRIDMKELRQLDAVVVQRHAAGQFSYKEVRSALGPRGKIVFELDDAVTLIPPHNSSHLAFEKIKPRIEEYLWKADLVTVSTPYLKYLYEEYTSRIAVLPNSLDLGLWNRPRVNPPSPGQPLTFLFSGTLTHEQDIQMIEEVILRLIQEYGDAVHFLFWGDYSARLAGQPHISYLQDYLTDYREYANLLQQLQIDAALVPLADNPFNRAKSHIKWLEYAICKIPGVFSRLGEYEASVQHGKTGLLVGNTFQDWYAALQTLIHDAGLRRQMAENAYQEVVQGHSLEQTATLWLKAYQGLWPSGHGAEVEAKQAQVSIIIPMYNNLDYNRDCLESLYQTASAAYPAEIIAVDNGSQDGTGEFLAREEAAGRIRVVSNPTNLGFAPACNQGAQAAQGADLLFLNNDTVAQPGWLEGMLQCMAKDENVGIVGAKLLYPDDSVQHAGVVFNDKKQVYHLYNGLHRDHPAVNKEREFQVVTGACLLIKKDLFERAGQFDASYINGFEDVDLCLKVRQMNYRVVYTPKSVLYHLESKTPGRFSHNEANSRLLTARWYDLVRHDDMTYYQEDGLYIEKMQDAAGSEFTIMYDQNDNVFHTNAKTLQEKGQLPEARKEYQRALRFNPFDPRNFVIQEELADLNRTMEDYAAAERNYMDLLRVRPQAQIYWKLGVTQRQLKKYEDAIVNLEKAKEMMEAQVIDLDCWRLLKKGKTLKQKKDYIQAIATLEQAKTKLLTQRWELQGGRSDAGGI